MKLVSRGGSTFADSGYTKSFLLSMLLNRQYPNTQYITQYISPLNYTGNLFTRTVQPVLVATMRGTVIQNQNTITDYFEGDEGELMAHLLEHFSVQQDCVMAINCKQCKPLFQITCTIILFLGI